MNVYFDTHYTAPEYAFDTTRKANHIADAIRTRGLPGTTLVEPTADAIAGIEALHTAEYVDALRHGTDEQLSSTQGFTWDQHIWDMAVHTTAGLIAATDAALDDGVAGSLSSGLHHARSDSGAGYCTVNGLVIAAHRLVAAPATVAILDLDAHCGGGTAEMLAEHDLQAHVRHHDGATDPFDMYDPTHPDDIFTFVLGGDEEYLAEVDRVLDAMPWDRLRIVLYNAGMDPHPVISKLALEIRERMVFERAAAEGVPVAWVLAGGYTTTQSMDELVALHLLTVDTAAAAAA